MTWFAIRRDMRLAVQTLQPATSEIGVLEQNTKANCQILLKGPRHFAGSISVGSHGEVTCCQLDWAWLAPKVLAHVFARAANLGIRSISGIQSGYKFHGGSVMLHLCIQCPRPSAPGKLSRRDAIQHNSVCRCQASRQGQLPCLCV